MFLECQRVLPGVLYLPHLCQWWDTLGEAVRATFVTLLQDLEPLTPVLWLATADVPFEQLPSEVSRTGGAAERDSCRISRLIGRKGTPQADG